MRRYKFYTLDVFTETPFGGNPLAVFINGEGLSDVEMHAIAREMNLSETTFVLPPTDPKANVRVRIWTPGSELPLAGHPVVGTHWLLAELGWYQLESPTTRVWGQLGVGTLPVDLSVTDGKVTRVTMTQAPPQFMTVVEDVTPLAAALGLTPDDLAVGRLKPQVVSTGVPQLMVPVASLDAMRRIVMDARALDQFAHSVGAQLVFPFSLETESPQAAVHTRGFAPAMGIAEDAATGSATGALGAYVVQHRALPLTPPTTKFVSEQGLEMGRPSTLFVEVDGAPDSITAVRVGGTAVTIIEGELTLR
jgi:trans-2,3-dihydro-3-hydroxyanthranilate isomerase